MEDLFQTVEDQLEHCLTHMYLFGKAEQKTLRDLEYYYDENCGFEQEQEEEIFRLYLKSKKNEYIDEEDESKDETERFFEEE